MIQNSIYLVPTANRSTKLNLVYGLFPQIFGHEPDHVVNNKLITANSHIGNKSAEGSIELLESTYSKFWNDQDDQSSAALKEYRRHRGIEDPVWGITNNVYERFNITQGDHLFFYTGDKTYTAYARVADVLMPAEESGLYWPSDLRLRDKSILSSDYSPQEYPYINDISDLQERAKFVNQAISAPNHIEEPNNFEGDVIEFTEYPWLVPLEDIHLVSLGGNIIKGLDDRNQEYIHGFSKLDPDTTELITNENGDLREFLTLSDKQRIKKYGPSFTPEVRRQFNRQYPDINLDPELSIDSTDDESSFALKGAESSVLPRSNAAALSKTLLKNRSLVLLGPPLTGKQRIFDVIKERWGKIQAESDLDDTRRFTSSALTSGQQEILEPTEDRQQMIGTIANQIERADAELTEASLKSGSKLQPHYLHIFTADNTEAVSDGLANRAKLLGPDNRGPENRIQIGDVPLWMPEQFYIGLCIDAGSDSLEDLPSSIRKELSIRLLSPDLDWIMNVCDFESDAGDTDQIETLKKIIENREEPESLMAESIVAVTYINLLLNHSGHMGIGYHGLCELSGTQINPVAHSEDGAIDDIYRAWEDSILPEIWGQSVDINDVSYPYDETILGVNDPGTLSDRRTLHDRIRATASTCLEAVNNRGISFLSLE